MPPIKRRRHLHPWQRHSTTRRQAMISMVALCRTMWWWTQLSFFGRWGVNRIVLKFDTIAGIERIGKEPELPFFVKRLNDLYIGPSRYLTEVTDGTVGAGRKMAGAAGPNDFRPLDCWSRHCCARHCR